MSEVCNEPGATVGIEPDTVTIRCQLEAGHRSKHHGRAGWWLETWGRSDQPDPWTGWSTA